MKILINFKINVKRCIIYELKNLHVTEYIYILYTTDFLLWKSSKINLKTALKNIQFLFNLRYH